MPPPLELDELPQLTAVWAGQAATVTAPPKTVFVTVTLPPSFKTPPPPAVPVPLGRLFAITQLVIVVVLSLEPESIAAPPPVAEPPVSRPPAIVTPEIAQSKLSWAVGFGSSTRSLVVL